MAAREFKDGRGREWRVWDVEPDDLNPRTKDEDFLAQLYLTGWLVFENKAGDDKRRLSPIPRGWDKLPDAELEDLLGAAEMVPPRKLGSAAVHDVTELAVLRTFRYPTGRMWAVREIQHPEDGGPPVLQLAAGSRKINLEHWPKDWADYPDEELVNLLRGAAPRQKTGVAAPGMPHRRWDDAPSSGS